MKRILALLFCFMMAASMLVGCGGLDSVVETEAIVPRIALITGPSANSLLQEGARKAASELNAEMVSMGSGDADVVQQISDAVSSGFQAMVIAGVETEDISAALTDAAAAGVKSICVDMAPHINAEAVVAMNQEAAGKMAGETMIAALQERGIMWGVVGIVGTAGDAAAQLRENGFRGAFEGENYSLLDTIYVENDADAQAMAENGIAQGIAGIFCCGESVSVGFGNAVKESAANMTVVGFGASESLQSLVQEGYIQAVLSADYEQMGYEAMKAAVSVLSGEVLGGKTIETAALLQKTEVSIQESVESMMEAVFSEDCSDYRIALIAPDRFDPCWEMLEEGAMKAAEDLGCEVVNMSAYMEDDDEQIHQIEDAVEEGFDAIIIAGNDPEAITPALQDAIAEGVRVVCVDTYVNAAVQATFFMDHKQAGRTAAKTMLEELEKQEIAEGVIGVIGVDEEETAPLQLEDGFREVFEGTAYTLMETAYCEGDAAMAHGIALEYMDEEVVGIFCCNEAASIGTGNALEEEDGETVIVGFGATDRILEMIEDEILLVSVAKDPDAMGYGAVTAACTALSGRNLGGTAIDSGVMVLTEES